MPHFTTTDIPSLNGKFAIVTGATSGLGFASVIHLAHAGARVLFTARSTAKAETALEQMNQRLATLPPHPSKIPPGAIEFDTCDFTDLESVNALCNRILSINIPIDILMLNAGCAMVPYQLIHGVESQLFINNFGHRLMIERFLELIKKAGNPKIVLVSSDSHTWVNSVVTDAPSEKLYNGSTAYGNSKAAQILTVKALARRFEKEGIQGIHVNAAHPGATTTNIIEKAAAGYSPILIGAVKGTLSLFFSTADHGALTQLFCATSPNIETQKMTGRYFVPVAKEKPAKEFTNDETAQDKYAEWEWAKITSIIKL
ncbi:UNVERIFIED_CONTAM: Retinol dehydrogenase 14 [Siphonaria sp. JEL0065]|nr:Retinol dehydrogenase 14 [Siphonaria sp. JEL0065]